MNRKQRRAGARSTPPREGLICRADAALILQRDRRTIFRYEEDGLLGEVFIDNEGNKWFELESVMRLAARFALERRNGRPSRSGKKSAPPAPAAPQAAEGYYPERRTRRPPRAERPTPVERFPPPAPPLLPPKGEEKPPEEKPLLPSAKGATAIRTTTVVDPNWFNEDLEPENGKGRVG